MSSIQINLRSLRAILILSALLSVIILGLTYAVHRLYHANTVKNEFLLYVMSLFNLSSENTIASWFGSMLLCLTGLFAVLCFSVDGSPATEKRSLIFSRGWLVISATFMLMSLDEMGSVHENLGALSIFDSSGDQSWQSVVAIPLVLIFGYMIVFAWKFLRNQYATLALFAIGAKCFLSIPVQEHFEMKMWAVSNYSPDWKRPIGFVLLEEGAELIATICFLLAMNIYINKKSGGEKMLWIDLSPVLNLKILGSALSLMMILCLCFYQFGPLLTADDGIAVNWFPSVMNFVLVMVLLQAHPSLRWYSFLSVCMISVSYAINFHMLLDWDVIFYARVITSAVILAGSFPMALHFGFSDQHRFTKIAAVLWIISIVTSLLVPSPIVAVAGFAGASVLCMSIAAGTQPSRLSQREQST